MTTTVDKTEVVKQHSLELEEDIPLFKKGIYIQRTGMALMLLLLICGALGIFGTGPLSEQKQSTAQSTIEYERFLRFQNRTEFIVRINNAQGKAQIVFPLDYLEHFLVESVMPEPEATEMVDGHMVYYFAAKQAASIRFFMSPEKTGSVAGTMMVNNEPIHLSHFIYR